MTDKFQTIAGPSQAVFTEKRSKFIAFAWPVKTAEQAKAHVDALAKEYYDARHVCWAYMLGPDRTEFRANDNGEPSGTAGKPILGQINSLELTDIVIAVVRYFGGIKLGTSGLIVAYREAARLALEEAEIIQCHVTAQLQFTFPYAVINDVMKIARAPGVAVLEQTFDNSCSMTIDVNLERLDEYRHRLDDIDGLTFNPSEQS